MGDPLGVSEVGCGRSGRWRPKAYNFNALAARRRLQSGGVICTVVIWDGHGELAASEEGDGGRFRDLGCQVGDWRL